MSVVCRLNPSSDTFPDAPNVIVEVISESTRRVDEHEKREAYLSIETLCVDILVEQAVAAAVVYRRMDSGFVRETYVGSDAVVPLPEIECELALADLYENVDFPPPTLDEED